MRCVSPVVTLKYLQGVKFLCWVAFRWFRTHTLGVCNCTLGTRYVKKKPEPHWVAHLERVLPVRIHVKWSGKFGQRAKVYPTRTNGYDHDEATELFRQV